MALNPLKRIVKSTLNRDPIQEIFWGTPTADTYNKVIYNYRSMPYSYKQEVIGRCLKKLGKVKQAELVIANLALLHKLMKIDSISLPVKQPEIQQNSKKKQIIVAQRNFIKFYFTFLKQEQLQISNKNLQLQDKITVCEIGLNKSMDIIKNNIVIQYCIGHSPNQVTLRIALKQIFEDIRKDLEFTTNFIQSYAKLIYEENTQISFAINEVYQNLIFINKNIHKISVLIKKCGLAVNLPIYKIDRDLNMKIEMQMNMRKNERMKFKTEKHIKSRKLIDFVEYENGLNNNNKLNNNINTNNMKWRTQKHISQSLSEIDQDEIFIMNNELL